MVRTPAEAKGVALSPDGTRLAVAGADNRARLYALDGKLLEFLPHDGPVLAVAFTPDGKRVITASADKGARVWTPALVWQANHAGPVRQAVFSPKGDRVLSASDDKSVQVWNAADGKLFKAFAAAHEGPALGVAVSLDGTKAVSIGADKTVKVWTILAVATMPEVPPIVFTLPAAANAVTISPNGLRVAAALAEGAVNQVRVFDVAPLTLPSPPPGGEGRVRGEVQQLAPHTAAIRSLAFLADNRTLVSGGADKTAKLSDVNVGLVLEVHPGGATGVAYHSNGTQLLTAGADKTAKLWDIATGKVLRTFGPLADPVTAVVFSRDFARVGAAAGKVVKVWTTTDAKEVQTLTHPAAVTGLSFSVDNLKIATSAADNSARVWDMASGLELQFFSHAGPATSVVFHPNNINVVSGSADKMVQINTLNAARTIALASPGRALTLTPNASHLLAACDDKTVKLVNLGTGAVERSLAGAEGPVKAVAVAKNNVLVAAGGADQKVRLYNFADGKELKALALPGVVRGVAFSPNNLVLAVVCENGAIAAFNVSYTVSQPVPPDFGKEIQNFTSPGGAFDVTFAADNQLLHTAGDKAVRAWKVAAEAPTKNFAHPNIVGAVAFSPTAPTPVLATGCSDGKLRLFDVVKGSSATPYRRRVRRRSIALPGVRTARRSSAAARTTA